jgi:hypothetical protein
MVEREFPAQDIWGNRSIDNLIKLSKSVISKQRVFLKNGLNVSTFGIDLQ